LPTYVVVGKPGTGEEWAETAFDADNDSDAQARLPAHIPDHLKRAGINCACRRAEVDALKYYPRMARPQIGFDAAINMPGPGPLFKMEENADLPLPHDAVLLSSSLNQLTVLVRNLEEVFRSIEPTQANMHVYGHLIRNILLLAAMEFESECKGVLAAHGYTPPSGSGRWSTADFVKVLAPLRLQEFEVNLSLYPAIASREPFRPWNANSPTQSLPWYDAYNAVKHDREREFHRATVESAIDAVTACAIMLAAEYRVIRSWKDQIGSFFEFKKSPEWKPEQRYVFHPTRGAWQKICFHF
jgi:hypothetical protein